jgi:hypothetical protein
MLSLKYFGAAALVMGLAVLGVSNAADEKKDDVKFTIKEVMKVAHGKDVGLLKKAQNGTISDDEKKKLVEAYLALSKNKPAKGDTESWKKFTDNIAAAAKEYGEGKDDNAKKLTKALLCKDCHMAHR